MYNSQYNAGPPYTAIMNGRYIQVIKSLFPGVGYGKARDSSFYPVQSGVQKRYSLTNGELDEIGDIMISELFHDIFAVRIDRGDAHSQA